MNVNNFRLLKMLSFVVSMALAPPPAASDAVIDGDVFGYLYGPFSIHALDLGETHSSFRLSTSDLATYMAKANEESVDSDNEQLTITVLNRITLEIRDDPGVLLRWTRGF